MARGGNQGKPAVDAKIDARLKVPKVEAWAFVHRDGTKFLLDRRKEPTQGVMETLSKEYVGGKWVHLVPYSSADAAVLKAAETFVKGLGLYGSSPSDERALVVAVERRQKAVKKPVTPPK